MLPVFPMQDPFLEVAQYLEEKAKRMGAEVRVSRPPEGEGDIAIPVGFALAKRLKKNPETAAKEFVDTISHPLIKNVKVIGGYVNVFLDRERALEKMGEHLGQNLFSGRILIDYSSPNIAKPLHVGHLKSTIVGAAIYNISKYLGFDAIGENWLGDYGTQFGKLIVAYKKWVDRRRFEKDPIGELLRLYVKFHQEAEKDPELEGLAREAFKRLEEGDEEYVKLWKLFRDVSIRKFEEFYRLFDVHFDRITGESFYINYAKKVVELLREKGLLKKGKEREGKAAWIVDLEDVGLGKPVLLKSDGSTTYESRDLGTIYARFLELKPDVMIYVVGAEQALHFQQVFHLAKVLGVTSRLIHVKIGLVRLPEGKLSTRRGRIITAEEVWNKVLERVMERAEDLETAKAVARSAIAFHILKVDPEKETIFQWEKMLSLKGETGPYCIYAAVRAKHVLEKAESVEKVIEEPTDVEWKLVKEVGWLPLLLRDFPRNFNPSPIARHLYRLAETFNKFYEEYRILGSKREGIRLWITKLVHSQMLDLSRLLLLKVPERM